MPAATTEALERIRAREGQPGYEGPKITSYIRNVAAIQYLMARGGGDFMPKVIEDAIVGAVGRACQKMGWGSVNYPALKGGVFPLRPLRSPEIIRNGIVSFSWATGCFDWGG